MRTTMWTALALCSAIQSAAAQVLKTKTIELRHLKPVEAVKLLSPYVRSTGGGVFDVSDKIPIVTVRDTPESIAAMEKVLAKYDHSPATIRLVFQLIEADTGRPVTGGAARGGVTMELDSTLRSVLKFPSYRLLAHGVATVGEFSAVAQRLANADRGFGYNLSANVGAIRLGPSAGSADLATGTIQLDVRLIRGGEEGTVISTGLDVPLGHMVILGTAATKATGVALILTVKPELVVVPPR